MTKVLIYLRMKKYHENMIVQILTGDIQDTLQTIQNTVFLNPHCGNPRCISKFVVVLKPLKLLVQRRMRLTFF